MPFLNSPKKCYNLKMNLQTWRKNLQHQFIQVGENQISVYKNIQEDKPIAVLLHGFGGNYFGLTPLGFELAKEYSIIICDLPAHGKSSLNSFQNIYDYRKFYQNLIFKLKKNGDIKLILAHSFSCYLVSDTKISKEIPTIIINPVFEPNNSFLAGMKISQKSKLLMISSNFPFFSPFKALALQKTWSLEASKNIYQNMFACQNSARKLLAQKKTIPIALDDNVFRNTSYIKMAIIGEKDSTVKPFCEAKFRKLFPKSDFRIIEESGHLLPMEKPRQIAEIIFKNIK